MDAASPPRRRGRRPGVSGTRQRILGVARARFATEGYTATTIRGIATEAEVDAALVMQFFGSKEELFAAAMSITPAALARIEGAFVGPDGTIGEQVTRAFLDLWEGRVEDSEPMLGMLRGTIAGEQTAARMREFIAARLTAGLDATALEDPELLLRRATASSLLIGVIVGRHILRIPPLATESHEDLIRRLAPVVQQVLITPVEGGTAGAAGPRSPS